MSMGSGLGDCYCLAAAAYLVGLIVVYVLIEPAPTLLVELLEESWLAASKDCELPDYGLFLKVLEDFTGCYFSITAGEKGERGEKGVVLGLWLTFGISENCWEFKRA
jgi:hypothetical protein